MIGINADSAAMNGDSASTATTSRPASNQNGTPGSAISREQHGPDQVAADQHPPARQPVGQPGQQGAGHQGRQEGQ